MKARDIMTSPVVTIRDEATLEEAARLMTDERIGGLAVVDAHGGLVGFITDSDFAAKERGVPFSIVTAPQVLGEFIGREGIEKIYEGARRKKVREMMSAPAITASEDETVERVVRLMMDRDVNRIVVTRGDRPTGIVARHDLLRILARPDAIPR